jgi:hypothetical protein
MKHYFHKDRTLQISSLDSSLIVSFIGLLSESIGLTAAIALGAAAYGLSLVALLVLPETRGRRLAVD